MRIVTPLLVILVIFSLAVNGVMYMKLRGRRPIFSVNGQGVTKKDLDDFLENKEGPSVKAEMVRRMLVDQEAKKQNVTPTEAEINEAFETQKEDNWQFAFNVNRSPWTTDETKKDLKMKLAATRLTLKDVPVADSEIKEAYDKQPAVFDTFDKAKGQLAVIADAVNTQQTTQEVITLLSKNPPVAPAAIMTQYPQKVFFIGNEYKFTFKRPFQFTGNYQNKRLIDYIYAIKPGEVKQVPLTPDIAQIGGKAIVYKMLEVIPGHKADLNDPKTKEALHNALAAKRAKPFEEILSGIWARTDFQSDNPEDKKQIEAMLFPSHQKPQ